jgi:hypothetical protein
VALTGLAHLRSAGVERGSRGLSCIAYLITLRHLPFACCRTRIEAQQLAFELSTNNHPRQIAVLQIPLT